MEILQTNNTKANLILFWNGLKKKNHDAYLTGTCMFLGKHPHTSLPHILQLIFKQQFWNKIFPM